MPHPVGGAMGVTCVTAVKRARETPARNGHIIQSVLSNSPPVGKGWTIRENELLEKMHIFFFNFYKSIGRSILLEL